MCVDGSATDARRIAKVVVARCPAEITLLALALAASFVGLLFTIYLFPRRPRD